MSLQFPTLTGNAGDIAPVQGDISNNAFFKSAGIGDSISSIPLTGFDKKIFGLGSGSNSPNTVGDAISGGVGNVITTWGSRLLVELLGFLFLTVGLIMLINRGGQIALVQEIKQATGG